MTISDIIHYRKGSAGSNRSWRVERDIDNDPYVGTYYSLFHYSTLMLRWRESTRYGVEPIRISTGNGSVSDQQGMNTAFKVLGLPYYFSRKGGATIEGLD